MLAPLHVPAPKQILRRSLRASLFLEAFILLTISVSSVTVTAYLLASQELRSRTEAQLNAAAQSRALLFENAIAKQREQISILAQDPKLTALASITRLIGFEQLLTVDVKGDTTVVTTSRMTTDVSSVLSAIRPNGTSVFYPIITDKGWTSYVIAASRNDGQGKPEMTLLATFDAAPLISQILHADYLGKTAEVLLMTKTDGERIILQGESNSLSPLLLRVPLSADNAVIPDNQSQGVFEGKDYVGIPVIGAYRNILSVGWTVVVKIDRFEVTDPLTRIAMNLLSAGLFVVGFLSFSMYLLSKRIVGPLEELTKKFDGLEARHWKFGRSIFTGNELESLDRTGVELTKRLRQAHDHLESLVQERTGELRSQHAEDAAILQSMEDGLIVTDAEGAVTYANRAASLLTGWEEERMHGKPTSEILQLVAKEGTMLSGEAHPLIAVLRQKQSWHPRIDPELTLVRQNGEEIALQIRVTPILDRGRCTGAVALIRDTTEERRVDRMKSEFITLVSHQLRTPLSSMRWYLEMLLSGEAGALKGDQETYVKEVDAANNRMVQLVNALLNVSKIELGKYTLHPTPIDLGKLSSDIIGTLQTMQLKKKVTVECLPPNTPLLIESDSSLLTLIIENLISNGIKYSGGGTPVQINIDKAANGKDALLTVRDRGIGIPASQQHLIGRKLFRGTNATTLDTDGNGLGLYISFIAAETIGAKLTFESTEFVGTTFSLILPLHAQTGAANIPTNG